jgi:DNA-directed RNA polymerase specialized sigma24 family protein
MPWLFAIARHTRVDVYRRRNKIDAAEVVAGDEPLSTRHRWCSPRSPSIGLWKLVDRLPPKQREVIHLAKRWGLTLEEVAQTTDTTVAAVKQRTHRAYLTLRADLAAGLGSAATNE